MYYTSTRLQVSEMVAFADLDLNVAGGYLLEAAGIYDYICLVSSDNFNHVLVEGPNTVSQKYMMYMINFLTRT